MTIEDFDSLVFDVDGTIIEKVRQGNRKKLHLAKAVFACVLCFGEPAKAMLDAHNATITATSRIGKGVKFVL